MMLGLEDSVIMILGVGVPSIFLTVIFAILYLDWKNKT